MASLYVFDIDDTLFDTTARTIVRDYQGNEVCVLQTPEETYAYKLKPGESFDYVEFTDAELFNKSAPISKMIENYRRIQSKIQLNLNPGSKIMINTARGSFDNLDKFLETFKKHGMDVQLDNVHCAGTIPGSMPASQKKLIGIRKRLDEGSFDIVFMYDVSATNLRAFLTLRKEYPNIKFHALLVNDGDISNFNE